jgi:ribonuclease P protein component
MPNLPKSERLTSKRLFSEIFKNGESIANFPLRVVWKEIHEPDLPPVQMAVSVPKKKIKLAVQRNEVKRKIKEAYRHSKKLLTETCTEQNLQISLVIIYLDTKPVAYEHLKEKTNTIIEQMVRVLSL